MITLLGTHLIIIEVKPSQEVNYFVKSDLAQMAYIRRGVTNMRLSPDEIKAKIEGWPNRKVISPTHPKLESIGT